VTDVIASKGKSPRWNINHGFSTGELTMQTGHVEHRGAEPGSVLADLLMGAVAGAAAVWVMDRVDWFNYRHEDPQARQRTEDARPGGLPPAQVAVAKGAEAAGAALPQHKVRTLGKAVHYSFGMAPGALYGVLRDHYPVVGTGRGFLFGLGVFLLQDEAMNPILGLSGKPRDYPWQAHARGLVAHLVYNRETQASGTSVDMPAPSDGGDTALRDTPPYEVRMPQDVDRASARTP
jgi:uncharacterized membrane protein YagU involved in acid resistance